MEFFEAVNRRRTVREWADKLAYSQKSGQEMRKKIQSKLTAKDSFDLIRGQPAKRRMRPV